MQTGKTTEIQYVVNYGPKKEKDRELKTFDNSTDASNFFTKKSSDGFHVNAYEIKTTTEITKIS